jgi:hypothetical protein
MSEMTVTREQLRSVYRAIGVDTADEWDDKTLLAKIGKLTVLKEKDFQIPDKKVAALYDELVSESAAKTKFVLDGNAEPAPATKKAKPEPKPKAKPAAKAKPEPKAKGKAKPEPKAKGKAKPEPKAKKEPVENGHYKSPHKSSYYTKITPLREDRGIGIAATVIEILKKASERKPLTKDQIHEALVKAFPDRDPDKMLTSVNNLVPTRLKLVRNINVWKSKKKDTEGKPYTSFWIPGEGDEIQPKAEKPEPKQKKPSPKKVPVKDAE